MAQSVVPGGWRGPAVQHSRAVGLFVRHAVLKVGRSSTSDHSRRRAAAVCHPQYGASLILEGSGFQRGLGGLGGCQEVLPESNSWAASTRSPIVEVFIYLRSTFEENGFAPERIAVDHTSALYTITEHEKSKTAVRTSKATGHQGDSSCTEL